MSNSANPWPRLDAWLHRHAPQVLARLHPPASSEALQAGSQACGRELPIGLREAYLAHDGARGEARTIFSAVRAAKTQDWVRYMWWLPIVDAARELRFMQGLGGGWPATLLPIAVDAGGNHVLVDLDSGTVLLRDHENGEHEPLAPDFRTWMTWIADDMDTGRVVADPDQEDDDGLSLLAAPPDPPPAPPALAPDRAARVLLEVLVERGCLALAPGVSTEPLVEAVHVALSRRSEDRRLQDVIRALEDSDAVDEIFADDERIAAAIEDVG